MSSASRLAWLARAVSAAGVVAIVLAVGLGWDQLVDGISGVTVLLALAAVVAELLPIRLRRGQFDEEITTSAPATFAVLILAGLPLAVVTTAAASAIADVRQRKPAIRIGFNVGQFVLSACAAAGVLALLSDLPGSQEMRAEDLPAVGLAAVVLLAVSHGLVGWASSLAQGIPLLVNLRRHWAFELEVGLLLVGLGPVVVVVADFSAVLLPVLLLWVLAVRRMARQSLRNQHEATHDRLTGLRNRDGLAEWLGRERDADRAGTRRVAVALADLDRFKELNDTVGHARGDRVLVELGRRLTNALPPDAVVARLGGDEFAALVVADNGAAGGAAALAIHEALAPPFDVAGLAVDITASVGTADGALATTSLDDLLRDADVAMYVAKQRRSRTESYRAEIDTHTAERLTMLTDLRRAIDERRLELAFQPIMLLSSGAAIGVEALVRWHDPVRGTVPPNDFIGLAEASGLIGPLTELVLDEALGRARTLRDAGTDVRVAINVSTHSLLDEELPRCVGDALERHDLDPDALALEITESSMMTDVDRARATLRELSGLGVPLAIDDFGTGHSTLSYLSVLPVDELKIDRSFIRRIGEDQADRSIVQATIALAHELGLVTVAEGIETPAARDVLSEMGCTMGQGYYFHPPMPGAELGDWLGQHPGGVAAAPRARRGGT